MKKTLSPALRALANQVDSQCAVILETDADKLKPEQFQAVPAIMRRLHCAAESENRSFSAQEQALWDALKAVADEGEKPMRRLLPNGAEIGREGPADFGGDAWRDQNGNEVRVYSREDRVSQGPSRDYGGATLGGVVRAMITGPRNDGERRALAEGSSGAGGVTVPTPLAREFIDMLRARTVCIAAGARTVPMDSATLKLARVTGDVPAGWRSENAAVATGDPTFDAVTLTAQSLAGTVTVSRELLQDSVNIDAILAQEFAKKLAVVLDAACLVGSGSAPTPRGLASITGVTQVSMGTNGAALTNYSPLLDLRRDLDIANANPPTAWLMHPRTARVLAGLTDTGGQPLRPPTWLYDSGVFSGTLPNHFNSEYAPKAPLVTWTTTTGIPITQTQGSASNASSVYAGDFTQMLIGVREEFHLEVVPQLYAANGQVAIIAHMRADMAVTNAAQFGRLIGIIP